MPIKGLSERRRLPRLGKLHLGVKAKSTRTGSEYPKAVDYFVLPHEESDSTKLTSLGQQIAVVYGDKPRELDVVFPVEDEEQVFPQCYKNYRSGAGLWCKGDGETASRVNDNGVMEEIACKGEECEHFQAKKCRAMANLMVMLPRISLGGVFQIDTSSVNSIIDINSGIDMVKSVTGRISLVPLKLRVQPRQVTAEGKKKIVYTMTLALATFDEAKVLRGQLDELRQLVSGGEPIALPAPQAEKFEESHLIPASVQAPAPERPALPARPADVVDQLTGEVLVDAEELALSEDEDAIASTSTQTEAPTRRGRRAVAPVPGFNF